MLNPSFFDQELHHTPSNWIVYVLLYIAWEFQSQVKRIASRWVFVMLINQTTFVVLVRLPNFEGRQICASNINEP